MTSLGWLHVGAAAVALVAGSLVFVSQKGARRHVLLAQVSASVFSGGEGLAVLSTSSGVVAVGGVVVHLLRSRIERSSARGAAPTVRPVQGGCA